MRPEGCASREEAFAFGFAADEEAAPRGFGKNTLEEKAPLRLGPILAFAAAAGVESEAIGGGAGVGKNELRLGIGVNDAQGAQRLEESIGGVEAGRVAGAMRPVKNSAFGAARRRLVWKVLSGRRDRKRSNRTGRSDRRAERPGRSGGPGTALDGADGIGQSGGWGQGGDSRIARISRRAAESGGARRRAREESRGNLPRRRPRRTRMLLKLSKGVIPWHVTLCLRCLSVNPAKRPRSWRRRLRKRRRGRWLERAGSR